MIELQEKILALLREHGPMTTRDVVRGIGWGGWGLIVGATLIGLGRSGHAVCESRPGEVPVWRAA